MTCGNTPTDHGSGSGTGSPRPTSTSHAHEQTTTENSPVEQLPSTWLEEKALKAGATHKSHGCYWFPKDEEWCFYNRDADKWLPCTAPETHKPADTRVLKPVATQEPPSTQEDWPVLPDGHRWLSPMECHGNDSFCTKCSPRNLNRPSVPMHSSVEKEEAEFFHVHPHGMRCYLFKGHFYPENTQPTFLNRCLDGIHSGVMRYADLLKDGSTMVTDEDVEVQNEPLDLDNTPPRGWHHFGTHVDYIGKLEFSDQKGEDGMPLWERPLPITLDDVVRTVESLRERINSVDEFEDMYGQMMFRRNTEAFKQAAQESVYLKPEAKPTILPNTDHEGEALRALQALLGTATNKLHEGQIIYQCPEFVLRVDRIEGRSVHFDWKYRVPPGSESIVVNVVQHAGQQETPVSQPAIGEVGPGTYRHADGRTCRYDPDEDEWFYAAVDGEKVCREAHGMRTPPVFTYNEPEPGLFSRLFRKWKRENV